MDKSLQCSAHNAWCLPIKSILILMILVATSLFQLRYSEAALSEQNNCATPELIRNLLLAKKLNGVIEIPRGKSSEDDFGLLMRMLRNPQSIIVTFSRSTSAQDGKCYSVIWLRDTKLRLLVVTTKMNGDHIIYGPLRQGFPGMDDISDTETGIDIIEIDFDHDENPEIIERVTIKRMGYQWSEFRVYKVLKSEIRMILSLVLKWDNSDAVEDERHRAICDAKVELKVHENRKYSIYVSGSVVSGQTTHGFPMNGCINGRAEYFLVNGVFVKRRIFSTN